MTAPEATAPRKAGRSRQTTIASCIARPIVKSAGGKTRLLPVLRKHLPASFGRYFEPFCGGAAMFFDVMANDRFAVGAGLAPVLGDLNVDLIETYSALVAKTDDVIENLERQQDLHRKAPAVTYYTAREIWNDERAEIDTAQRAALFLYLNKTCFNGLWRVNQAGAFNVPMGRYNPKTVTICDAQRLRAAAKMLATATIMAADYRMTCGTAERGDFVYFDPPYDGDSFTSYTADKFDAEAQGELAAFAKKLAARGVHVLLSNHDTWLVRELYESKPGSPWTMYSIAAPRSIAANGDKRSAASELLISSYGGAS